MFHQSLNRNQRTKGSKPKRILQVSVLLAVVVWLLYQTKHSYDRKAEYAETDYNKLGKENSEINFGRKVNAGSQNEISVSLPENTSDESIEDAAEVKNESEESQEVNVDNNVDSSITGEVNTEGTQEDLSLPMERDGENFDQTENTSVIDNSSEENELPKDDAIFAEGTDTGTVTSSSSNEATVAENGETSGEGYETGETVGENSEAASENANLPNSTEEINVAGQSEKGNTETAVNGDDNNVVMTDSNGDPGKGGGESQAEKNYEEQTAGNSSTEVVTADTSSEGEDANLANSSEENGTVMSDKNGAPKDEGDPSQTNQDSEGGKAENNSSEEAKNETVSENEQSNGEKKENSVSEGDVASVSEVTKNNTVQENDPKSSDEVANASVTNEKETVEEVQSQEDKSDRSDDSVVNSAQNNDENNSDISTSETHNEEVDSKAKVSLKDEDTSNSIEEAVNEPEAKDLTTSEVGNDIELSTDNTAENEQEGNTGSESATSSSEVDLKKSAEL